MSCQIAEHLNGHANFYCSSSGWAFGPIFESPEEAQKFLQWLPDDPRVYTSAQLETHYLNFRRLYVCRGCGDVRPDETDCIDCKHHVPKNAAGKHVDEDYEENCSAEPEPKPGEHYLCPPCQKTKR